MLATPNAGFFVTLFFLVEKIGGWGRGKTPNEPKRHKYVRWNFKQHVKHTKQYSDLLQVSIKFGRKNGMNLLGYSEGFMKFYQSFEQMTIRL